jgi:hypothetical protein
MNYNNFFIKTIDFFGYLDYSILISLQKFVLNVYTTSRRNTYILAFIYNHAISTTNLIIN